LFIQNIKNNNYRKSKSKTMHIAYSALQQPTAADQYNDIPQPDQEPLLRYRAYQAACTKYSKEIAAIQKYIPGWMPAFR
jgi:hypothetical protein